MMFLGLDIGSTSAKAVLLDHKKQIVEAFAVPTGWSSFDAVERIYMRAEPICPVEDLLCVATGYGRGAVKFAKKTVTEITCHARGAGYLFGSGPMNVIDVGGQDTKVITVLNGRVEEFFMNDKCSAGTGRFIEVMANRLQVPVNELGQMAAKSRARQKISSMCTVFAETEIISLIGMGTSKEDIAWGILDSVAGKVAGEYGKLADTLRPVYLTGGLCENTFFTQLLSEKIGGAVFTEENARYAGAIGAALTAAETAAKERSLAGRL